MVRNYVRKTASYDKEAMKSAMEAVASGAMGYKKAAGIFNVKRETLRDQVRKRYAKMGAGRNALLTPEMEIELAECLKVLARWGFGFTRQETRELIAEYLQASGKAKEGYIPTDDWLRGFMSRNPTITARLPEQLKASRAKCMANRDVISHWFQLLKDTLQSNNLMNKPHLIFNVDESGFPTDPSRIRVLCEKNISHLFRVIGGSGRESITVNGCYSADGTIMPPFIVYPGKNLWDIWTRNGPDGARYTVSEKGWMDSDRFFDWFERHFIPNIPKERPVVLIFDGHASHMNRRLYLKARENGVILLKLPSNSTNLLQPLDVGLYGPVKTAWEKILIKFARQNLGTPLTKELFPMVLKDLWSSACMSAENVKAGFRRCGVYPFDPSAVPSSMYDAANIFDKADPSTWVTLEAPPSSSPSPAASSTSSPSPAAPSTSFPSPAAPSTSYPLSAAPSTSSPSSAAVSVSPPPVLPALSPAPPSTSTIATQRLPLSPRKSIKDFFLRRISPMLAKNKDPEKSGRKMIRRLYGESLTSDECLARLQEEETKKTQPKRQNKGKGKGKSTKIQKMDTSIPNDIENSQPDIDSDSSTHDDSDNDHDWLPTPERNRPRSARNVFDLTF